MSVALRERVNGEVDAVTHAFRRIEEGAYELQILEAGEPFVTITIDRLRRESGSLVGELAVQCAIAGALTFNGVLSTADLNLSSQRARTERAVYLATRARAGEIDWRGLLDEFALRVLTAERAGQPAVDLRTLPRPEPDDNFDVDGLSLPRRHPSILFGDGGAAKSYLLVHYLGSLAKRGFRVALFDWELAGEDHRDRLERLFGRDMPAIAYTRCERPLQYEVDRLRRICRDYSIDFAGYDSVAFACDGPPEAAEVAGRYFRATRAIGPGSLHIAHVSKAEGADQKPFGSTFWHNGARATWYARLAESTPDGSVIQLGLFNRKANLGPLRSAVGFEIGFSTEATTFHRIQLQDIPDLASKLPIRLRMTTALRRGSMTAEGLASEIQADVETVRRTLRRYKDQFVVLDGGRVGLSQRGS